MQQGDYSSYYHQYPPTHIQNPSSNTIIPNSIPNQNPSSASADLYQTSYASAPPYSGGYPPSDHSSYFQNYAPHPPQNPDPAPPSAPSYNPPPKNPFMTGVNPNSHSYPPYDSHAGSYQQTAFYQSYDHNQTAPPSFNPNTSYTSYSSDPSYNPPASSVPPASYDNSYENLLKFDQGTAYSDEKYSGLGRSRSNVGSDPYGMQSDVRGHPRFDNGYGDGVYAYEGGKSEPYGARGTAPRSSNSTLFDDYGRPLNLPSSRGGSTVNSGSSKIARAVPIVDEQADAKGGVQKFRVTLFCESGGPNTRDVLCQVGLDGIRFLDPSTSRTLKIYPLENVTRCEVYDSSTIAFWSKSPVDTEPRCTKLQSNRYTNNTLLDTITAAIVQFKEMGETRRPQDLMKTTEQNAEKKKGFGDWMNLIKPVNVEKDHWVPDEAVSKCTGCGADFSAFNRRHHCRNCGDIFCDKCTQGRTALTSEENAPQVRVCDRCLAEVTHRLNIAKEAANRPAVSLQSHEDLARKLKEEMEKNRRSSSGSRLDSSGRRMKEVACPTCTVHLQVQVPISGSETIECGVCQNPFRVSAH